MLQIRPEQMEKFQQAAQRRFEDRMVAHLKKFFPENCGGMPEKDLREFVRHGLARSKAYGITGRRDVCHYLDIMAVFGRDFDVDPRLPWAQEILGKSRLKNATAKVQRLYGVAMKKQLEGAS